MLCAIDVIVQLSLVKLPPWLQLQWNGRRWKEIFPLELQISHDSCNVNGNEPRTLSRIWCKDSKVSRYSRKSKEKHFQSCFIQNWMHPSCWMKNAMICINILLTLFSSCIVLTMQTYSCFVLTQPIQWSSLQEPLQRNIMDFQPFPTILGTKDHTKTMTCSRTC